MSMPRQGPDDPVPSSEVRAEAAAWIARLRDEQRDRGLDAQFRGWLDESEEHRRAFARMSHVWEEAGNIRMRARRAISAVRKGRSSRFNRWAPPLAATTVILVAVGAVYYWHDGALETGVGQEKARLLRDGTRVVLNTDTRIEVKYDKHVRRVRLIRGEAWFDVSKRANWPFIVSVADQEIRALGTSFIVRHDNVQDLSVTLVDGRISVAPIAENYAAPSQTAQFLAPGDRLVVSRHRAPAMDRPELSRITAWERGRVEFDETTLRDATIEMNRYSTNHVAVPDAEVAQLRIGGVFRAGDSDEFVRIVTAALGLRADRNGHDIVLSRSTTRPLPPRAR
ncbi:MAG TPA: FecR domain-containing protein [Steroidobacteraceae bacterium]|nr:FecR domain-containing protein [Steroidobacteraceae bacterium]